LPLVMQNTQVRFERLMLPHLDAAYNLAHWLLLNEQDAEDVVQEAYMRAFQYFNTFDTKRGADSRSWLLTIVRRRCYTYLQREHNRYLAVPFDEELHSSLSEMGNPETLLLRRVNLDLLKEALETLPLAFREVIVLRELEGLSYKEIVAITDLPQGTVMSRLARARKQLQRALTCQMDTESLAEKGKAR
jgi:RNA polymerase sigma-70 factor (ECF subfamily)